MQDGTTEVLVAPGGQVPTMGSLGAAAWDFKAAQTVTACPGHVTKVGLRSRMKLPDHMSMLLPP